MSKAFMAAMLMLPAVCHARGGEAHQLIALIAEHDLTPAARAMVELIGRDWNAFAKFATEARREDGGAAAACAALSLELGELAAAAVNMQPTAAWNPRPEAWKHVSHKA
jgi:hypothetical protein